MPKEQSPGKPTTRRYSPEEKAAAVRMVRTLRAELGTEHGTVQRVARQLGYGIESVRSWVRQADIDDGYAPGVSTAEAGTDQGARAGGPRASAGQRDPEDGPRVSSGRSSTANTRSSRLHRRQPRRVRGRAHLHRPVFGRGAGGPEHLLRGQDTRPVGARRSVTRSMVPVLMELWEDNYRVYGARKLWKAARRAGHDVGRDQVARLMRAAGIDGVRRGKRVRTTKPDPGASRHPDLVGRDFTATAPNQLWVTDLTYVPTWAGVAYVCFIVDAFSRMIVGWRVAAAHAHHDGPRRHRDGPLVTREPRCRAAVSLRRRVSVHVDPLRRTARRDRRGALDRHRRRQLRQRPGRDRERLLQVRTDPRTGPHRALEDRRGRRAGHPELGPLAQHQPAARLPRRRPTSRVRSQRSTLRNGPTNPWSKSNSPSLHQTQGDSDLQSWSFASRFDTRSP